ncbi:MAG: 3-hydroxyanthranilate 3,4-dioxygenase [Cyclobacteriaceae bacterium]
MKIPDVHNLQNWIEEHRHLLKPPVGNAQVYQQTKDFIVMVVGGPNSRKDFHYNETEEFFYQIEGDITLKVRENDETRDIHIREGEMFLLPGKVPHSPRRPANTIGMVIEKIRTSENTDGLLWFCENCGNKLYEEYFPLENIVEQLPPIINKFHNSLELRTCDQCGTVMDVPGTGVPRTDVPKEKQEQT